MCKSCLTPHRLLDVELLPFREYPTAQLPDERTYDLGGGGLGVQAGGEDVIYFAARVAVVHDLTWKTQRLFTGHDDDIKSMAFHLQSGMVATGQVRPFGSDQYVVTSR